MTVSSVDAGPRRVSRTVEVQAPAGELFALVADPSRHGELDGSGTVPETVKGPQRLTEDARFSVKMKQYGVPYRITSRVTEISEGRVVEWRHPFGHRWRWEFTPPVRRVDPGDRDLRLQPGTVAAGQDVRAGQGPRAERHRHRGDPSPTAVAVRPPLSRGQLRRAEACPTSLIGHLGAPLQQTSCWPGSCRMATELLRHAVLQCLAGTECTIAVIDVMLVAHSPGRRGR